MTLYEFIVNELDKKNLTVNEFQRTKGTLSYHVLKKIKDGVAKPSPIVYVRLAKFFNTTVDYLKTLPLKKGV